MNNELFFNILNQTENLNDLKASDIPSLDLYMDQIMTLFDTYLNNNKRYDDDKLLTKTMINNYSKAGILKPIKGKKYTKEHILQMLMIYYLKNTISIQEIKEVLQPFHESESHIEEIYTQFLSTKNELSHDITLQIEKHIKENHIDLDNQDDLTITLLLLCSISNQFKIIAEKMLDTFYLNEQE
jgi:DNA-binding transcriptional MerR regulator